MLAVEIISFENKAIFSMSNEIVYTTSWRYHRYSAKTHRLEYHKRAAFHMGREIKNIAILVKMEQFFPA